MATGPNSSSIPNLRSTKKNAEQNGAISSEKNLENSLKVKFDSIKTLISRQKDELDLAFNNAIESCRNELTEQICETNTRIDSVESDLQLANKTILELKQKIIAIESREQDHLALTKSNIFQGCRNEQRHRSWSVKIINFQNMSTEATPNLQMIWEELILPSLQDAHSSGQLKWLPETRDAVIEHGHETGIRKDSAQPQPFMLRFHSRSQMYSFFNNMKPHIKALEERNASIMHPDNKPAANMVAKYFPDKKIKAISSITNMNSDLLSYLYTYSEVEHVKMLGNFLGVKIRGSNTYRKITNPFGLNLPQMMEPMKTVTSVLAKISNPVPPLVTHSLRKKQYYQQQVPAIVVHSTDSTDSADSTVAPLGDSVAPPDDSTCALSSAPPCDAAIAPASIVAVSSAAVVLDEISAPPAPALAT